MIRQFFDQLQRFYRVLLGKCLRGAVPAVFFHQSMDFRELHGGHIRPLGDITSESFTVNLHRVQHRCRVDAVTEVAQSRFAQSLFILRVVLDIIHDLEGHADVVPDPIGQPSQLLILIRSIGPCIAAQGEQLGRLALDLA
mgnify:CR=1 FL=1